MVQLTQAHNQGNNYIIGKDGYFWFDEDNKVSSRYILSITITSMGQFNKQPNILRRKYGR